MHSSAILVALAASILDVVSAHGFVNSISDNGKYTAGSDPVWYYYPAGTAPQTAGWDALNQDIGFVAPDSFTTSNIACHKSATAGKLYANVNAGDTIQFHWSTWPDSHKGPIMNYIAPCGGECSSQTAANLRWSKISQSSIVNAQAGTWVTDTLIQNNFTASVTIPRNLKAGNYVIRHEIIALHGAQSDNGAQAYPQCLNLKVGGSGTVAPTNGIPGTSLYTRSTPGIIFNLYTSYTSYPYPGPQLWTAAN